MGSEAQPCDEVPDALEWLATDMEWAAREGQQSDQLPRWRQAVRELMSGEPETRCDCSHVASVATDVVDLLRRQGASADLIDFAERHRR